MASLRSRLIAAQLAVVLVGVLALAVGVEWTLRRHPPAFWAELLASLPADDLASSTTLLLALVRRITFRALFFAGLAATLTGLLTSWLLTGELLRPLRDLARSSRRIAVGHYDERVAMPASTELATVAESFNQMADTLEQIEAQRVALIGNVMHELRTPLTALGGYVEGMMDGVLPADERSFDQMDHEVRRLQRLVADLQELSRVEAGQVRLSLEDVDLTALTARLVQRLAPQAMAMGIALTLNDNAGSLFVHADPDRTTQILINLVGNAINYTLEGGTIIVSVNRRNGLAEVTVEDSGIGIAASDLPFIFERFFRTDRSRDRRTGGSGIGLTIARHLAWAMGGDISATSEGVGQGSQFSLSLPVGRTASNPV
ncbi:MAG: HAMP domain-containing histidine kinase [Ardenticatenales bacterium]|nr:HAMP domain-containing histidine kinase [Ardenticatenales bacterium]